MKAPCLLFLFLLRPAFALRIPCGPRVKVPTWLLDTSSSVTLTDCDESEIVVAPTAHLYGAVFGLSLLTAGGLPFGASVDFGREPPAEDRVWLRLEAETFVEGKMMWREVAKEGVSHKFSVSSRKPLDFLLTVSPPRPQPVVVPARPYRGVEIECEHENPTLTPTLMAALQDGRNETLLGGGVAERQWTGVKGDGVVSVSLATDDNNNNDRRFVVVVDETFQAARLLCGFPVYRRRDEEFQFRAKLGEEDVEVVVEMIFEVVNATEVEEVTTKKTPLLKTPSDKTKVAKGKFTRPTTGAARSSLSSRTSRPSTSAMASPTPSAAIIPIALTTPASPVRLVSFSTDGAVISSSGSSPDDAIPTETYGAIHVDGDGLKLKNNGAARGGNVGMGNGAAGLSFLGVNVVVYVIAVFVYGIL